MGRVSVGKRDDTGRVDVDDVGGKRDDMGRVDVDDVGGKRDDMGRVDVDDDICRRCGW